MHLANLSNLSLRQRLIIPGQVPLRHNSQISEIMEKINEFSENVNDQSADAAVGKGLGIRKYYFTFHTG